MKYQGIDDDLVIQKALDGNWILVTNDKDFGEKVFKEHRLHHGIILLRLANESAINKISVLKQLIDNHEMKLSGKFIVVTEKQIRFAKGY